jgi:hypothetical protein
MRFSKAGVRHGLDAMVPVQNAEYHRDKEQGRDGGKEQAPDHGAPERRVLLAAFA